VQSAVLQSHVVCLCLSVTLVDHDHIGWKSWKLIAWTISPTSSFFIAKRSFTYSQGNMEKFWGENVHSTPTSITSDWIESTESHVILGGGVAVCLCLLLSAHRVVVFAIAQLSCSAPDWTTYCSDSINILHHRQVWIVQSYSPGGAHIYMAPWAHMCLPSERHIDRFRWHHTIGFNKSECGFRFTNQMYFFVES